MAASHLKSLNVNIMSDISKVIEWIESTIAHLGLAEISENHPQRDLAREALPQFEMALKILKGETKHVNSGDLIQLADDNTYMKIISCGLLWGGRNPEKWKTGQDVVDFAKEKYKVYSSSILDNDV